MAETMYSGTMPSKGKNISSATPCKNEPNNKVRMPPMRSLITPNTSRLTMPLASMSESISAPRAAPNPRSEQ
jgi:hypothetical protein